MTTHDDPSFTAHTPAAVIAVGGKLLNWETVSSQLAGALSTVMVPRDAEIPWGEIERVLDEFTALIDDNETPRTHTVLAARKAASVHCAWCGTGFTGLDALYAHNCSSAGH